MSNIKFVCKKHRKAIIDPKLTPGRIVDIGEVEEYEASDTEIKVNIKLYHDLPAELYEAVTKNPACIRISEALSTPMEVLIIPSRPKLDIPD